MDFCRCLPASGTLLQHIQEFSARHDRFRSRAHTPKILQYRHSDGARRRDFSWFSRFSPRTRRMQTPSDKKKLHGFLSDLLRVGCVKVRGYDIPACITWRNVIICQGFLYFACHLRGREEMICSVSNEPSVPILLSASNSPASSFALQSSADQLPREP